MAKKTPAKKSSSKSASTKTAKKKPAPAGKADKKSVKKTAKKKTVSVKKTVKKALVRKAATKKATTKKVPVKASPKPAPKKKVPSKKAVSKPARKTVKNTAKKPVSKSGPSAGKSTPVKKKTPASATRSRAGKARTQTVTETTSAPDIRRVSSLRGRTKAARRSAFTLDDVREIAKRNEKQASKVQKKTVSTGTNPTPSAPDLDEIIQENRVLGAASLADILGYVPGSKTPQEDEEKRIPKKHIRYYRLLVELRDHVNSELSLHTEDTLKRSSKEDSGDLSSYSQHIADAGTDTFDRDFALSLVSSEQEALHEVEEAINRIKTGTYGICELTGKPISKERLMAVPFARYSVESQAQVEKTTRRNVQRGGIFADATAEDSARFVQDDSDD